MRIDLSFKFVPPITIDPVIGFETKVNDTCVECSNSMRVQQAFPAYGIKKTNLYSTWCRADVVGKDPVSVIRKSINTQRLIRKRYRLGQRELYLLTEIRSGKRPTCPFNRVVHINTHAHSIDDHSYMKASTSSFLADRRRWRRFSSSLRRSTISSGSLRSLLQRSCPSGPLIERPWKSTPSRSAINPRTKARSMLIGTLSTKRLYATKTWR